MNLNGVIPGSDCSSLGIGSLGCTNNLFSLDSDALYMYMVNYCSCKFQML